MSIKADRPRATEDDGGDVSITNEMRKSAAFRALSSSARSALIEFLARASPDINGKIELPTRVLAPLIPCAPNKAARTIAELIRTEIVVITEPKSGRRPPKYEVTALPVGSRKGTCEYLMWPAKPIKIGFAEMFNPDAFAEPEKTKEQELLEIIAQLDE